MKNIKKTDRTDKNTNCGIKSVKTCLTKAVKHTTIDITTKKIKIKYYPEFRKHLDFCQYCKALIFSGDA